MKLARGVWKRCKKWGERQSNWDNVEYRSCAGEHLGLSRCYYLLLRKREWEWDPEAPS